jgi:hypothetical protein
MLELYEQQVAETRRMNGTLERIAEIMEKRRGAEKPAGRVPSTEPANWSGRVR